MQQALDLALKGKGRVSPNPLVGCVIVDAHGHRIGAGYHKKYGNAHAEVEAIRSVEDTEALKDATVYVTLEPCAMCAALISASRIRRLYYGASDIKSGGVEQGARIFSHSQTHHRPEIYPGICEEEVVGLMSSFFGDLRQ